MLGDHGAQRVAVLARPSSAAVAGGRRPAAPEVCRVAGPRRAVTPVMDDISIPFSTLRSRGGQRGRGSRPLGHRRGRPGPDRSDLDQGSPGRRGRDARAMSLRVTARSRAIASLHRRQRRAAAVEEVVLPADLAERDAQHRRPGRRQPLLGRVCWERRSPPRRRRAPRPARSAPSGRSCCWRSAAAVAPVERRRDHVLGQRRQPAGSRSTPASSGRGPRRRPPAACPGRPARRPPRRRHGRRAPAASAFSISPISIRKPRILTWVSRRPRNSSLPVGPPAAVVAAPVEPLARRGGGRRMNASRVRSGIVDVPAADADAGERRSRRGRRAAPATGARRRRRRARC